MVTTRYSVWRSLTMLIALVVTCLMVQSAHAGNPRYAGIVVDAETHEILYAEHADESRYPASLTKMMTLYMLFESLEGRSMSLGQPLPVSSHAASMPATKLWLKPGDTIPVEKAIQALIVRSANDVAVVVAESLGGTESHFAEMMTRKARSLGMNNTTFRNASGLPDSGQVTTARDMVILARRLMLDFPQYYPYFSLTEFTWRGTRHTGHNRLLTKYPGTDGLKTGFIRASGFNVATSATRNGRRMVAVVMGGYTAASRDEQMMSVLDRGFLRASLSDGRGFLASTDVSGGELMAPRQRGLISAPVPTSSRLAQTSSNAVQPSRVETIVPPAQVASRQSAGTPVRFESSTPVISGTRPQTDPLRRLMDDAPSSAPAVASIPVAASVPTATRPEPRATASSAPSVAQTGDWGVQVGAFSDMDSARSQASQAANRLASEMSHARVAVARADNANIYRAQVLDLQEGQARSACRRLMEQGMDCMVVQASL
ncbi:SPOR domain-containing protein [Halomonas denitrificans]|uniref:serine hydrolase n=2 Tax=Halomonadaceae TaxID=28256 RepID=UPI001A8CE350|nr:MULTISPECIES: serine hydrolase [Halomonas]MBN8413793.1 SPOR domain-containing protein [Halomonas litopenaei]MBY5967759.1 SPOR domain-containing protein [Halomonas denitrificans]MBY5983261.1 SPOR domain-containing protein [Halomonas sp. DP5Y7-2]MCA0974427.1 SPOR domain-containing protein [Halomonas denitrificans]